MSDILSSDISGLLGATGTTAKHSTSRKNNTDLNMEDFLKLMIVQLTNQTIDDAMDTSEMMNQMIQMQMISAITNMTEVNVQSYANSLVGKVVTVGIVSNNILEEREIVVMGTGTYNGQQVIFGSDGNMYYLSQIMAAGYLPDENGHYSPGAMEDMFGSGWANGSSGTGGTTGENPDLVVEPNPDADLDPDFSQNPDLVVEPNPDADLDSGYNVESDSNPDPEYGGENGVPTD